MRMSTTMGQGEDSKASEVGASAGTSTTTTSCLVGWLDR